jgi:hypothetical protein
VQNVAQQIIKVLNETPNLTSKELVAKTGLDLKQVYYAVHRMRKNGKLKRRNGKYSVVFELPMTAITPTEAPVVKTDLKRIQELLSRIEYLEIELEDAKDKHHQALIDFYDARAVVKYLEGRLDEHSRKEG